MYIILLALLFAMIFYSGTAIIRMVKAVRASGILNPLGGGYGIGWFSILIILNFVMLAAIIIYYNYKVRNIQGQPGPKGYNGLELSN